MLSCQGVLHICRHHLVPSGSGLFELGCLLTSFFSSNTPFRPTAIGTGGWAYRKLMSERRFVRRFMPTLLLCLRRASRRTWSRARSQTTSAQTTSPARSSSSSRPSRSSCRCPATSRAPSSAWCACLPGCSLGRSVGRAMAMGDWDCSAFPGGRLRSPPCVPGWDGAPYSASTHVVFVLQQRTQLPVQAAVVSCNTRYVRAGRIVQRVGVCGAGARAWRAPGPVQEDAGHGEEVWNAY